MSRKELPLRSKEQELIGELFTNDIATAKEILVKNPDIDVNFKGKIDNYIYRPINFKHLYRTTDEEDLEISLEVLEILLERGADPNVYDTETFMYPLMYAIFYKNIKAFQILIDAGAKLDVWTKKNGSLLHVFARFCDKYKNASASVIMKQLISSGSKQYINELDGFGRTPLHYLSDSDATDLIKILMDHGADIHIKTTSQDFFYSYKKDANKQRTPIEIAMESGHVKTAEFIQDYYEELRAMQVYKDLQKVEQELIKTEGLSPSATLPFDVAMKIATIKMSPTKRYAFERKMEKKLRGMSPIN